MTTFLTQFSLPSQVVGRHFSFISVYVILWFQYQGLSAVSRHSIFIIDRLPQKSKQGMGGGGGGAPVYPENVRLHFPVS